MASYRYGEWTILPDDQPVSQIDATLALIATACEQAPYLRNHGNPFWIFHRYQILYVPVLVLSNN